MITIIIYIFIEAKENRIMWGAALIVFREVFEISIIMCVVLAATQGLNNRGKWIGIGILAGSLGAMAFALLTESVALWAGQQGKDYFNVIILFIAVSMIGWTVIWLKQHGKEIVNNMKQVSHEVAMGTKPHYVLSIIIGLAVLREGSEIVVFVYGLIAAGDATWATGLFGGLIGTMLGALFGLFLYYGLLKMSVKYMFQVPSILLTLIASGMAANAAGKLVHIGFLPALIDSVWNTSHILPQHSLLGRFLFILVGYQENPCGMQALFYFLTLVTVLVLARYKTNISSGPR